MLKYVDPKRFWKGLEPLIAAIILIAITLVIAIAVAAWLLGVFGTSVTGSEQLSIYPNGTLTKSTSTSEVKLQLWILNKGTSASTIESVVVGNGTCTGTPDSPVTIQPGQVGVVTVTWQSNSACYSYITPGITYQVKVQTKTGNVFFTTVTAS